MAQVQLYLAKSQHGYTGLGNINPSEDVVRHIHDFGSALEILDFESSRPEIFYLVQYIEEGLLLTLLRPIDSHAGSNYSATLHFPLGLKISKEQFLNIVGSIKEVLVPGLIPVLKQYPNYASFYLPITASTSRAPISAYRRETLLHSYISVNHRLLWVISSTHVSTSRNIPISTAYCLSTVFQEPKHAKAAENFPVS